MKKIWKYILSILLVIILGSVGTIYYFLNIKTYETADEEIKEIINTEYKIALPGETAEVTTETNSEDKVSEDTNEETTTESSDSTDSDSNTETSNNTTENSSSADNNQSKSSNQNQTNTKSTSTKTTEVNEVTVASIKDKYRPVFESLESQANGKIDSLVSRAFGEYKEKKANGESISFSYFYQKYSSAGKELEGKTDEVFQYVYKALEDDLKKNGFSPTHAKDFMEQYQAAKKARETALLNKAKEAL
ncbi:hypothetical protein [Neobacillus sp. D3-1R]|uniref:hypothetical protein n=1 Tax=Neobacillus sp. D3-1R TaxID=3445778 RepID=UPI003F9EE141